MIKRQTIFTGGLSVLASAILLFPKVVYPQKKSPTVVFYTAYIFEAKSNGDTLEFPLMPGETAIATLDNISETANGYMEKLRSIYSYQHFSFLSMVGGAFTVGLASGDGIMDTGTHYGAKKHFISLSASCNSGPQDDLLPIRIEVQLDTTTEEWQKFPDKNRIYFFKTLCTVKHAHPLVIGRPLQFHKGHKQAMFIVFTPFFQQLTRADQYDHVVANYRKVMAFTAGRHDLGGRYLFKKINRYFETKLKKKDTMSYDDIIASLPDVPPPPPPPQVREDSPIFIPHDKNPEPIGGYAAIQRNLRYPEVARKAGIEGRLMVWAKINEHGEVIQTRILTSLGPNGCDEAAMQAISSVKWKPAMRGDQPITVWIAVPVDFRLK